MMRSLWLVAVPLFLLLSTAPASPRKPAPPQKESDRKTEQAESKASSKPAAQSKKKAASEEKWELRETPFGPMKRKAKSSPAEKAPKNYPPHLMQVEQEGDRITFKKKTPFGNQVWTKKRSELTDAERRLLNEIGVDAKPDKKPSEKPVEPRPSPQK